jgi:hypothetical protein
MNSHRLTGRTRCVVAVRWRGGERRAGTGELASGAQRDRKTQPMARSPLCRLAIIVNSASATRSCSRLRRAVLMMARPPSYVGGSGGRTTPGPEEARKSSVGSKRCKRVQIAANSPAPIRAPRRFGYGATPNTLASYAIPATDSKSGAEKSVEGSNPLPSALTLSARQ